MAINTLEQAEKYAAQNGIVLTQTDLERIAKAQSARRSQLEAAAQDEGATWADKFNRFYPRLLETIIRAGETLLTLAQTIIVSLGVPVVLVLLLVVEHHRVVEGILLFDQNTTFASFAAAALVVLNLVLEFQVHYVEHRAGYEDERRSRWSLRIWSRNMAYRLGLGDDWTVQHLSPAARYKRLLSLVTFTILALALVGSMRTVIQDVDGAWYVGMVSVVTDSSLLLMMTWTGGLLFAAAAVLSAQGLSRYVANRCVEIVAEMEARQAALVDPHAEQVEQAGATAAVAIIQAKLDRKAQREQAKRQQAVVTEPDRTEPDRTEQDTEPVNPIPARQS